MTHSGADHGLNSRRSSEQSWCCRAWGPGSADGQPIPKGSSARPVRFRARWRTPEGKSRSETFDKWVDADRKLVSVEHSKMTGSYVDPAAGRVTFSDRSERWLAESVDLKPRTLHGYRSILNKHVLPRWGPAGLARIDRSGVKAWVTEMVAAGKGPGTIRNVVNVLKGALSSAVDAGVIATNPAHGVRLPRPATDEMLFLTAGEVDLLARKIDPRFSTLVIFAAFTGLRAGECAALRWDRVDLLRATVDVVESAAEVAGRFEVGPTKTYERRSVQMPRFVADLLGEHQAVTGPGGFVFRSPAGGPMRHTAFYRRQFKPAVNAAELDSRLRFHDLRHTAAALLVVERAHPLAVKERLGHSSITVTMDRYGHLFPAVEATLAEGLDRAWNERVVSVPCHGRVIDLGA
jgi:integrase